MFKEPGMINLESGLILIDAPEAMFCVTFKMQFPPTAGSMKMDEPDGKVAGGMAFSTQLSGLFQFPLPTKEYVVLLRTL